MKTAKGRLYGLSRRVQATLKLCRDTTYSSMIMICMVHIQHDVLQLGKATERKTYTHK